MPQPPLDIVKYLGTPLIPLREQYPPGTGGTGPRADWAEGTLKGVEVIQDFEDKVNECTCRRVEFESESPSNPFRPVNRKRRNEATKEWRRRLDLDRADHAPARVDLKTVPTEPVRPHPAHKYPKFVQARANLPSVLKSPADLQKCEYDRPRHQPGQLPSYPTRPSRPSLRL